MAVTLGGGSGSSLPSKPKPRYKPRYGPTGGGRLEGTGGVGGPRPPSRPAPKPAPAPSSAPAPSYSPAPAPAPAPAPSPPSGSSPDDDRRAELRDEFEAYAAAQRQERAEEAAAAAEAARQEQLEEMIASIREMPLDPATVAAFAERERLANRGVSEAQNFAQQARGQSKVDFNQFVRQLAEQVDASQMGLRQDAAARNLAFQPAFVGVGMRDIRDQAATSRSLAEQQRAQFLVGIQRQVEQARAAREAELAALERDRARAQADHRAFIDAQIAALVAGQAGGAA